MNRHPMMAPSAANLALWNEDMISRVDVALQYFRLRFTHFNAELSPPCVLSSLRVFAALIQIPLRVTVSLYSLGPLHYLTAIVSASFIWVRLVFQLWRGKRDHQAGIVVVVPAHLKLRLKHAVLIANPAAVVRDWSTSLVMALPSYTGIANLELSSTSRDVSVSVDQTLDDIRRHELLGEVSYNYFTLWWLAAQHYWRLLRSQLHLLVCHHRLRKQIHLM